MVALNKPPQRALMLRFKRGLCFVFHLAVRIRLHPLIPVMNTTVTPKSRVITPPIIVDVVVTSILVPIIIDIVYIKVFFLIVAIPLPTITCFPHYRAEITEFVRAATSGLS